MISESRTERALHCVAQLSMDGEYALIVRRSGRSTRRRTPNAMSKAGAETASIASKSPRGCDDSTSESAPVRIGARELNDVYARPTIAMIRGYCIGGGVGLALCCDLRICSDDSRFAVPAAKLGLGYSYHGLKKLVDVVGISFAKEIFYTARQFDAEEARTISDKASPLPKNGLATIQFFGEYQCRQTAESPRLAGTPARLKRRGSCFWGCEAPSQRAANQPAQPQESRFPVIRAT